MQTTTQEPAGQADLALTLEQRACSQLVAKFDGVRSTKRLREVASATMSIVWTDPAHLDALNAAVKRARSRVSIIASHVVTSAGRKAVA